MASQDPIMNRRDPLDAEEDLRSAFAELARAPLPMRPAYATQLRGTLRAEFAEQAVRRGQAVVAGLAAPGDSAYADRAARPAWALRWQGSPR